MNGLLTLKGKPVAGALIVFGVFAALAVVYAQLGISEEGVAIVLVLNAIMVVGTQIFVGNTGILSFGHIGLVGVAAYTSAILSASSSVKMKLIPDAPFGLAGVQLSAPLAILAAVIVTAALAAVIGIFLCRLNGIAASIVTFAILEVIWVVEMNWTSLTGGSEAFYGAPRVTTLPLVIIGLFVTVVVARLFMISRAGLRARATREDEVAAGSMGVGVYRSRFFSWVLSAVFAAFGGALYGHFIGTISPNMFFENIMFLQMAMLVLGGMFSVTGALAGVVLITVVTEVLRWLGDGPVVFGLQLPMIVGLSSIAYGVVIVLFMILRPKGLLGEHEVEDMWTWFKRRRGEVKAPPQLPDTAIVGASAEPIKRPASTSRPQGAKPILSVRDVSMHFAGLTAVDKASLEVYPGEIVGLIGPNGAGKTTLLNMISGLYKATSGEIVLDGRTVTRLGSHEIARLGVGRTFQSTHLFRELTVRENVDTAAQIAKQYRASSYRPTEQILTQFGLQDVAERKAGQLPYGIQRQVEMARAVALGPDLLLLDEPAAGTNDVESLQLVDLIVHVRDAEKCAILLIDHDLPFVLNLCERLYVLDAGKVIAEGSPRVIQENPKVREAYLGSRQVAGLKHGGEDASARQDSGVSLPTRS